MQPHAEVAVPPAVLRFHQPRQPLKLPCKGHRTGCGFGRLRHPCSRSVVVICRPAIAGLLCLPFCPKAHLILRGNVSITVLVWRVIDL